MVATVEEVITRPERPEYILLEASGVPDPSGIAMTFIQPQFRDRIRLDSIVFIVDAEQVFAHSDYPALEELKMRQKGFSDSTMSPRTQIVAIAAAGATDSEALTAHFKA